MKSLMLASAKWLALPPGLRRIPGRQASSKAFWSAVGHSRTGSDRYGCGGRRRELPRWVMVHLREIQIDLLHDHLGEDLAGLDRLQPDVTPHRRCNSAMTQDLA